MFKKYRRIVVLDTETTGLRYNQEEIIDIGAIVLDHNLNIIEEINELVRASKPLPDKIIEITGITDAMLINGIPQDRLAEILMRLCTPDTLIVAYNLQFDISFIVHLIQKYNPYFTFQSDVLDMLTVYKDHHDYPHKLSDACETYHILNAQAHRAIHDAIATYKLMLAMKDQIDLSLYINNIGYHHKFGLNGLRFPHINYYSHPYIKGSLKQKILMMTK